MKNSDGTVQLKNKKLKDEYTELTLFKIKGYDYKSFKKS
jgi:hypothetical protein